jgi:hypothetical protein
MRDCWVLRPLLDLQPQFSRPLCTWTGACFTTDVLQTAVYLDWYVFYDRSFADRCVHELARVLRPEFCRPLCTWTGTCFTTAVLQTAVHLDWHVFYDHSFEDRYVLGLVRVLRPSLKKKRNNSPQHWLCAIAGIWVYLVCRFSFQHLSCQTNTSS